MSHALHEVRPALAYCDHNPLFIQAAKNALLPDADLTVSEWADRHRILTSEASAESGRWRTERFPFLREPMDVGSPRHPCEFLVMRFASQLGKSETQLNILFTYIDIAPCPILWIMPNVDVMQRTVKTRLHPGLRATPSLAEKIPTGSKVAGQSVLSKEFPGGHLDMGTARSPSKLSSMPVRLALGDEVDRWPHSSGGEGDPVGMLVKRTENFHNRKVVLISSPSIEGSSRIDQEMATTDDRRFLVPCPHCGKHQELVFSADYAEGGIKPHGRLVWEENKPETAKYQCAHCSELIDEKHKSVMLAAGYWRASRPDADPRRRGYHLSGLYTPAGFKQDWAEVARKFLESKNSKRAESMQVFVNTVLGVSFRDRGQAPDFERLHERREPYRAGFIPGPRIQGGQRPLVLTAGADVQKDRIEYEVVGWAPNGESWSIEYEVLPGDPFDGQVFVELEKAVIHRVFPMEDERGPGLPVSKLAIDSGYATQPTYAWVRQQERTRVIAVKGRNGIGAAVGKPSLVDVNYRGRTISNGLQLWPVDDGAIKGEIYNFLKKPLPNETRPEVPGACHFPLSYPVAYFQGLTAEQLVLTRDKRGYQQRIWEKLRERNEPLDCRKYARAAFIQHGFDRWPDHRWTAWRGELFDETAQPQAAPQQQRRLRIPNSYS